ncbi:transporter substrate-binding domain-containing protein [Ekhidna sp.]
MRYCLTILLITFLHLTSNSQGFKGDTWAESLRNKRGNVILTNVHLAKFSDGESGKGTGICFDIMDDFAEYVLKKYGVVVTYKYQPVADPTNFQMFLTAVENSQGGVFGLGDITITDQRKNIFDFSPPYFSNMAVLVTEKSVPQLSSLGRIPTTFKGMRAVSQGGTTHDKRLKELKDQYGFDIIYAASSVDKTFRVITSPKYFTYIDLPNYLELRAKGENIKRHPAGDVKGESYGFILPKGSDWTPVITEFFNADGGYMKGSDYKKVLSTNLNPEVVKLMDEISSK